MTVPSEYAHASAQFDRFLDEARRRFDHVTTHQTYQSVEGVLRVFRRHLTVEQAIAFAGVLPAVLRAIFVADWRTDEPVLPFGTRDELNREVQAYRRHHNLTPVDAIATIASILPRYVDPVAFEKVLTSLPEEAAAFWRQP